MAKHENYETYYELGRDHPTRPASLKPWPPGEPLPARVAVNPHLFVHLASITVGVYCSLRSVGHGPTKRTSFLSNTTCPKCLSAWKAEVVQTQAARAKAGRRG